MSEKLYAAGQQQPGAQPGAEAHSSADHGHAEKGDTVVDAEFEEVRDDKK